MMKVTPCFSVSFGIKKYPDFLHLLSLIPLVFIMNVLCTHVCHWVYQYEVTALQTSVTQGHFFSGSLDSFWQDLNEGSVHRKTSTHTGPHRRKR